MDLCTVLFTFKVYRTQTASDEVTHSQQKVCMADRYVDTDDVDTDTDVCQWAHADGTHWSYHLHLVAWPRPPTA